MAKIKILALFLFVLADRVAKKYILDHPNLYSDDFVKLNLFKNKKLFFLFFGEHTNLIISIAGILLLISLVFLLVKTKEKALLLIIAGGLSNVFDRFYYGYVIDFIQLKAFSLSVFNIADVLIFLGIICLIFNLKKSK